MNINNPWFIIEGENNYACSFGDIRSENESPFGGGGSILQEMYLDFVHECVFQHGPSMVSVCKIIEGRQNI